MLHEGSTIKKTTNLYCLRSVQSPPSLVSRLYTYKVPSADATSRRKTFWILKKQQGNKAIKNNSIIIPTCTHIYNPFCTTFSGQRNLYFSSRTALKYVLLLQRFMHYMKHFLLCWHTEIGLNTNHNVSYPKLLIFVPVIIFKLLLNSLWTSFISEYNFNCTGQCLDCLDGDKTSCTIRSVLLHDTCKHMHTHAAIATMNHGHKWHIISFPLVTMSKSLGKHKEVLW